MSNINLHFVDIAIIAAYLIFCLILGFKKYGTIKTIRDYTLGSKTFPTAVLIATTFATAVNAGKTIGIVEKSYSLGLVFIIPALFVPICWLVMSRLLLANFNLFKQQRFSTLGDIMEYWYGKTGRWVTNICSIIYTLGVTAISISALGYLFHYFFNISELDGALIGVAVVAFYSAMGGIQAVAFTDLFQFLIFAVALPLTCKISFDHAGGIRSALSSLPKTHLTIDSTNTVLLVSLILLALLPNVDIPYIQRALIAKDKNQLTNTFNLTGLLFFPLILMMAAMGLAIHVISPNINPSTALYHFIGNYLSPGIVGLVVAGLLAVIMSSQDSFLNTTSTVIARDICKQIWPQLSDKQELLVARVSCIAIAVLSILLVFAKQSILGIFWLLSNFWDAIIAVPLIVGLIGIKISERSFLILTLSVLSAETVARFIRGSFDTVTLMVGLATAVIVVCFANKKQPEQHNVLARSKRAISLLLFKLQEMLRTNDTSFTSGIIYTFSIIMLLRYVASILLLPSPYDLTTYYSVIAAALCVLLLLNELWGNALRRKFLKYLWHISTFFCLPFISSHFIFASDYEILWVASFIASAVFLYLITNPIVFVFLLSLGITASYGIFAFLGYQTVKYLSSEFAIFTCFFTIIAMIACVYKQKYVAKAVHEEVARVLEEKVMERTVVMKEALAVKEEFLSKLSHEMRTPLTGLISLSTEVSKQWDAIKPESRKSYVDMIAASGDRLMSYVKNILDFASYNKNAIQLELDEDVDLVEMAREAIQKGEMQVIERKKMLDIKLELVDLEEAKIICDKNRVLEIFHNLLHNAIKYSVEGEITIKIEKDAEREEVRVSVIDEGVGVPENERVSIFSPFTEGSRTKTGAEGKGLGLSIAREIVYLHKGTIRVEDNIPAGSRFVFTLPVVQKGFVKKPKIASNAVLSNKKKVILLIDDEVSCLQSMSLILMSMGREVHTGQGGVPGLKYIEQSYQNIDAILLDLMMPDMSGVELLKIIKHDPRFKAIPVIMQSAYTSATSEEIRTAESVLGAEGESIAKPYDRREVERIINKLYKKNAELFTEAVDENSKAYAH